MTKPSSAEEKKSQTTNMLLGVAIVLFVIIIALLLWWIAYPPQANNTSDTAAVSYGATADTSTGTTDTTATTKTEATDTASEATTSAATTTAAGTSTTVVTTTAAPVRCDNVSGDTITYQNDVLGVKFSYPKALGCLYPDYINGDNDGTPQGKRFDVSISSSLNAYSLTNDYTASVGGSAGLESGAGRAVTTKDGSEARVGTVDYFGDQAPVGYVKLKGQNFQRLNFRGNTEAQIEDVLKTVETY